MVLPHMSTSGRYVSVPDRSSTFSRLQTRSRVFIHKPAVQNRFFTKGRKSGILPAVRADSASTGKSRGGKSSEDKGPLQGLQNWWKILTGTQGISSMKQTWMSLIMPDLHMPEEVFTSNARYPSIISKFQGSIVL